MASVTVSGDFVEHNNHHGYLAHIQENEKNIDLMVFVPIDENDPLDGFNTLQAIGSQRQLLYQGSLVWSLCQDN